nr:hypothetical protein [Tanacetum cinerariifolium]
MTNDDHMKTMDALGIICNSIQDNINADVTTGKVSDVDDSINLNVDESIIPSDLIVQSVDINTKSTSYAGAAGASAKDQPKVNSNFRSLEQMGETWAERIMMNSKGFFFFKFDSRAGLEAVLEGGLWLIRKSPIILKKWSMDTRLLKEEIDSHSDMGNSKAGLVDVVTIGIPSIYGDGFTKETTSLNGGSPDVIYTNNGFQTVGKKKKRKCKSKSTNGDQFAGPSSSSMLKTTSKSSKKDSLSMSNSFSALNDEEDVKNVYDESANLIQNTKARGSSYFTAAAS